MPKNNNLFGNISEEIFYFFKWKALFVKQSILNHNKACKIKIFEK